jgi:hypothetical protein
MLAHERFSSAEALLDLVATDDGIVCVGNSQTYFDVSTRNPAADNRCALILKLPFDGKVPLHPGARGMDKYLQPLVHDSVASLYEANIPSPDFKYHGTAELPAPLATPQATTNGVPQGPLVDVPFVGWAPLEAGNAHQPMIYAQWAAYNQLPTNSTASDDFDGDGRSNGQEYFFGGDPYSSQSGLPTFTLTRGPTNSLTFTLTRSHVAQNLAPVLHTSTNLSDWGPLPLGPLTTNALDLFTDRLSFTLPITNEPMRFYRAASPPLTGP